MGNSQCCEEEAKGGEFVSKSKLQPNKISMYTGRLDNNHEEYPPKLKVLSEDVKLVAAPQSPPYKPPSSKWTKLIEDDLPIIAELVSKSKEESPGLRNYDVSKGKEQMERAQKQSNHSAFELKPQAGNTLQLQSQSAKEQPHERSVQEIILKQQPPVEIQMPTLNKQVTKTLQEQSKHPIIQEFFQNDFKFKPSRRQFGNDFYEGQLDQNNKFPQGLGKFYKSDSSFFIGHFEKGKAYGQGAYIFPDGSYYHGPFANNAADGKNGVYHSSVLHYEGDFKRNTFHGKGRESGPSHNFKGEYQNGNKTNGMLTWTAGEHFYEYEGSFDKNVFNGSGTLKEPTGIYKGQFIQGKKQGHGVYHFKNGLKYEGEYRDGLREGKGTIFNSNNRIAYEGEFLKGLPHGNGVILDDQGKKFSAMWIEGIDSDLL